MFLCAAAVLVQTFHHGVEWFLAFSGLFVFWFVYCVWQHSCHGAYVKVKEQLSGISLFLSTFPRPAQQQAPLTVEPRCRPSWRIIKDVQGSRPRTLNHSHCVLKAVGKWTWLPLRECGDVTKWFLCLLSWVLLRMPTQALPLHLHLLYKWEHNSVADLVMFSPYESWRRSRSPKTTA